jgi:hypothetical protein
MPTMSPLPLLAAVRSSPLPKLVGPVIAPWYSSTSVKLVGPVSRIPSNGAMLGVLARLRAAVRGDCADGGGLTRIVITAYRYRPRRFC